MRTAAGFCILTKNKLQLNHLITESFPVCVAGLSFRLVT